MTLETFFEKFDLFADAPDAVAKMRELILQLAVAGHLTQGEGSRRGNSRWIRLGDLNPEFQNGASSRGDRDGRPVVVLRLADIVNQRVSHSDPRMIPIVHCDIRKYALRAGDTLVTRVNGSADIVGSFIPIEADLDAIYCDHFIRMRLSPAVADPSFIALVGRTRGVRDQIKSLFVSTAGQKTVNQGHISSLKVPLPPLAEQKRIVAKVDELMALCDRLETQQQEREARHTALARASLARFAEAPTPANLTFLFHKSYHIPPADLRKSILTLAVQGKLVPQDPNDEPAEELMRTIDFEKDALVSAGFLKRAERVNFVLNDESVDLPALWKLATLASLCISVTDGDHLPPPKSETGIPFLVISNVRWGGINFEGCRRVTEDYFDKLDWIRKPKKDDILYTLVGSLGIPVPVLDERPFCVQRHIGILRPSRHLDRRYLAYALQSDGVFQQASSIATGIAQKTVPLAGLRKITVPLPPLAEQRRIVAKVDELVAMVDAMESQLATARTTATALLEAAVAEMTNQ